MPDPQQIPDGWTVTDAATDTPAVPAKPSRRRRRGLTGIAIVAALSLGLFGISTLLSGNNKASALTGHPEVLREGCTWDKSGNYVQNCKVWSKSQNKWVIVQIRASNGSNNGVYLLDGMRANEQRSAWTTDVQAAKVYDGSTDTTLVMPVGGASSFYTDWEGGAGDKNTVIKQETFLTSELPDYLAKNFGVSPNNNAIVGLSMSGGPAVTLAERHPEQFKVVQAMSGYYQTDNPLGALGVFASQTMVSNYTNGILNMWGAPGSQRWTDNDPSKNVSKLAKNGQVLIISSGNGFLTRSEMAKLKPADQINAIALEILSAISTVLMQLQAAQAGVSVISLPNYGGHTWENWGRALADGKKPVLDALRKNPPVTNKVTLVSATGSAEPEATAKATQAAKLAAATTPVLDEIAIPADQESTESSAASDPSASEKAESSSATSSAATQAPTTSTQPGTSVEAPKTDVDAEVPTAPAPPSTTEESATSSPAPAPSTTTTPPVSTPTTTTPAPAA